MKTKIITAILLSAVMTQAAAASTTLRYWNGSSKAQISGLKDVYACKKLAKQKQLKDSEYYCIKTGKSFDTKFERKNNWK